MLIKLTREQRREVKKFLLDWYRAESGIRRVFPGEVHRQFYSAVSSIFDTPFPMVGAGMPGGRKRKPNYSELGMSLVAGPPTDEEIEKYRQITDGGDLGRDGFVTNVLLFDNDLVTDRSMSMTAKGMSDLMSKYLGRANDFDHSFYVLDARARLIDLQIGSDPAMEMHPDFPHEAHRQLSPYNAFGGKYMAFWGRLAFPKLSGDDTTERIRKGLIKDVSIAFSHEDTLCSECLQPMKSDMCFTWCDEHGFPGGRTDEGRLVVGMVDSVKDAFTFGLVSDGAVARAGIVTDPFADSGPTATVRFTYVEDAQSQITKIVRR
jgi:hypothetical protein